MKINDFLKFQFQHSREIFIGLITFVDSNIFDCQFLGHSDFYRFDANTFKVTSAGGLFLTGSQLSSYTVFGAGNNQNPIQISDFIAITFADNGRYIGQVTDIDSLSNVSIRFLHSGQNYVFDTDNHIVNTDNPLETNAGILGTEAYVSEAPMLVVSVPATKAPRAFKATKQDVANRGVAPDSFLNELVDWAEFAPDFIFEENSKVDIYSTVLPELGPYDSLLHRKAVMLEVLRVLSGFESSWNWDQGIHASNPKSHTPCTEEAGVFQCSGDSMNFSPSLKQLLLESAGESTCEVFITHTKNNHQFAIDYCARLIRITTNQHGPIKNKHINPWLRKDAVKEFQSLL